MSDKWHYLMNGTQHGPVPFEELQRLAASGEIKETDRVWQQGSASGLDGRSKGAQLGVREDHVGSIPCFGI